MYAPVIVGRLSGVAKISSPVFNRLGRTRSVVSLWVQRVLASDEPCDGTGRS